MSRPPRYRNAHRVNIVLEKDVHLEGTAKADALRLRGGFSEYVSRLIIQDRKRKGRSLLNIEFPSAA